MLLPVSIEIEDIETCGLNCVFLYDGNCSLFNEYLNETELPAGYLRQEGAPPTWQRCCKCANMTSHLE